MQENSSFNLVAALKEGDNRAILNHDLNAKLNENIVAAYGITGFPTKILLNRVGVILNRDLDNRQLERMLKEIFDHSFH